MLYVFNNKITYEISLSILTKILETSGNVINKLNETKKNNNYDINNVIQKTDIHVKIDDMKTLMENINKDISLIVPIHKSLINLHNILMDISKELHEIDRKLKWNANLYFSYRSYSFDDNINNLILNTEILDKRMNYLLKLLQLNENVFVKNNE